jgi:hypothetical protein
MKSRLTQHAKDMLIDRVIGGPLWTEPEPGNPFIVRAFGRIREGEERILRVAYTDRAGERIVLSVHFDRKATRRYRSTAR